MLHSICQQIWKTQQWQQDWKRLVFIPIPKKDKAKHVQTTTQLHSSHMPGLKEPLVESERGEWKSRFKTQHSESSDHDICPHHFTANRWGNNENWQILFSLAPKSLWLVTAIMKFKGPPDFTFKNVWL